MKAVDMTFNIEQLAGHLGVQVKTVFNWMCEGKLKSLKGIDILEFGNNYPEHQRRCDALVGYYDCLLHSKIGPTKS